MANTGRYDEVLRSPRVGLGSPWADRLGWMVGSMFARIGTPDPGSKQRKICEADIAGKLTPTSGAA